MPQTETAIPDDATLAALGGDLGRALLGAGLSLAVAESCTGGWLAKAVTDNPGAGDWFRAGFVTYTNAAKASMLGVSRDLIESEGAVSEAVVTAMAAGARNRSGADAAIAISGIAGPTGGSDDKPVGLVWFGWSLGNRHWTAEARFAGNRDAVRRQAVAHAFNNLLDEMTVAKR